MYGPLWHRLGKLINLKRKLKIIESEAPEKIAFHTASTPRALKNIANRGIEIATVIDVGASNGMWSEAARPFFPDASYFLVEAQKVHEAALNHYCSIKPKTSYVLAAAGDKSGEIFFDDSEPFGGVAAKTQTGKAQTLVPVTTIDHEIEARGLKGPFLIKLDTHGFEVPILEGAKKALDQANLVVIETYNFRLTEQTLLFDEMCAYMRSKGFGVIDISEPLWRLYDNAFWQFDLFFVPLKRAEFSHNAYQ
jgi:FkbM family methyltransferase